MFSNDFHEFFTVIGELFFGISFSIPMWKLSKAIVYRFTKSDDRLRLTQFSFIVLTGALAIAWAKLNPEMFDGKEAESYLVDLIFIVLTGSALFMIAKTIFDAFSSLGRTFLILVRGA
jgi:hypothetical protein